MDEQTLAVLKAMATLLSALTQEVAGLMLARTDVAPQHLKAYRSGFHPSLTNRERMHVVLHDCPNCRA